MATSVGFAAGMIYNSWNANSSNFKVEFESILDDHSRLDKEDFNVKYDRYGGSIYEAINNYLLRYTKEITTAIYSEVHSENSNKLRALLESFKARDSDTYAKIEALKKIKTRNEEIFASERGILLKKMERRGIILKNLTAVDKAGLLKSTLDCEDGLVNLADVLVSHIFPGADISVDDIKYIAKNFSTMAGINTLLDLIGDTSASLFQTI